MQRVHEDAINAVIASMLKAAHSLWGLTVFEAIQPSPGYGKKDTFRLDAFPEIHLRGEYERNDREVVFVTEETGAQVSQPYYPTDHRTKFPPTDICDPFDRSNPMHRFLSGIEDKNRTLGELFADPATKARWEAEQGSPAEITGGCSAITRVIKGVPIFTVIVNFVTRQLIVACSAGVYCLDLPKKMEKVNLTLVKKGRHIYFPNINHNGNGARFVTFLKKDVYPDNFRDTKLVDDTEMAANMHFDDPGGPLRPLYLSDLHPEHNRPGFILANGEKLGEWAHWLTFLQFGRKPQDDNDVALQMNEIYGSNSRIKDDVLMAPTPPYSLFRTLNDREDPKDREALILDVGFFPRFPVPSRIRSTLVLAPCDNEWIGNRVTLHGYRRIKIHP